MFTISTFKDQIQSKELTKKELAERIYGTMSFDYALPQGWLNNVANELEVSTGKIVSQFVWLYPDKSILGEPGPLTMEAVDLLEQLGTHKP